MNDDEYWGRIKRIPIVLERDSSDGKSVLGRAQDGTPVSVTKPTGLSDEDKEAVLKFYQAMYGPRLH